MDWNQYPESFGGKSEDLTAIRIKHRFIEYIALQAKHTTSHFNKVFVDISNGDLASGILLSEVVRLQFVDCAYVAKNGRDWVVCRRHEWWERARLKPKQVDSALKNLIRLNLAIKKAFKADGQPTLHISLEIPTIMNALEFITTRNNPSYKHPRPGFVYLVQSPTGAYKIGKAKDPNDRQKTFGIQLPFEVEFIALVPTPNMKQTEDELHRQFADKRVNGEWFNLTPEDVEYIKGLAQ